MVQTLSVVTPSFMQGQFIERTILSVLYQKVAIEHIVMDGGSNDETVMILKKYEVGCRLRWKSEPDRGQSHAINKGLVSAKGDVIGWLNSDDVYEPRALGGIMRWFNDNPDEDVAYGEANHIDSNDNVINQYPIDDWSLTQLLNKCFICQPALFFRKRIVDKIGLIDERLNYCMDYEYWIRMAKAGITPRRLSTVLASSRLHEATKTLGSKLKVHSEINDMMLRVNGRVPDNWIFNYAHALIDSWGIARSDHLKFVSSVGLASIYASIKWNGTVTPAVIEKCKTWGINSIHSLCRRLGC